MHWQSFYFMPVVQIDLGRCLKAFVFASGDWDGLVQRLLDENLLSERHLKDTIKEEAIMTDILTIVSLVDAGVCPL